MNNCRTWAFASLVLGALVLPSPQASTLHPPSASSSSAELQLLDQYRSWGRWFILTPAAQAQTPPIDRVPPEETLPPPIEPAITPPPIDRAPIPEQVTPTPTPEPLPPPSDLIEPSDVLPDSTEPGLEIPDQIQVSQFEVIGSTVYDEDELQDITQPYTGRPITFTELLEVRSAITQRYIDDGYITSGAFIPAGQVIDDGVVTIQVIEGELAEINVEGLNHLQPSYVRSRIRLAAGSPLNVNDLLEGLQLLQLDPLIENLSVELAAGTRTGESILNVQVTPASTFDVIGTLDNGRSPSVGSFRQRFQVREANVFGVGDGFGASYSRTNGSSTWDFDYTVPFNPRNGTVGILYSATNSEVIDENFDVLNIESESETWELSVRQPLYQTPSEEFALGLIFSNRFSKTTFQPDGTDEELAFPIAGSNEEGETRLSALRFTQEWTRRGSAQVLALRSQFSLGTDWFDASVSDDGEPDSRFFAWQGQAQWVRLLREDTLLLSRINTQLATDSLLSLEQFGVGGQGSVRGYRQDQLLVDNGVFASVELRYPIARIPEWDSLIQVAPFVDYGIGWNNGDRDDPSPNELWSVGLGILWQFSDRLSMRLDWGIPLTDIDSEGDSLQENGFLFTVTGRL
ncbi:MAG: ShlB/FhaC/HecB family hemolysin secretion/activation protein [Thainema sp.]